MILIMLQIAAIACLGAYLYHWRKGVRRRNAQSWDSLLARLRPDWRFEVMKGAGHVPQLSHPARWLSLVTGCMEGPKGLWVMYQNARTMMEMADFAAKNSDTVDRLLLETLRSDAMQIRVCVLMALAQYGFSKAGEGVRINAFRAATMYTGMAARMTQLLQENAPVMVPDFVAAM